MLTTRRLVSSAILSFAVVPAFAASVAGAWYGRVNTKAMTAPTGLTPSQFASMKAVAAKLRIKLVLKADKSFTATFSGVAAQPETSKGTWSLSGSTVSLKAPGDVKKLVFSRDHKTLVMIADHTFGAKLIFTRR